MGYVRSAILGLASLLTWTSTIAEPALNAEIALVRAEIAALSQRLDRLEQAAHAAAAAEPTDAAHRRLAAGAAHREGSSVPPLRLSGDLRYRHESIAEEGEEDRHRQRLRARLGVMADVGEDLRLGLTLATGDDDPVSANQTLGSGFDRKGFGVDRAFFDWQATDSLAITGGKMPNPFFRTGGHHLVYDADLNPEGLALRFARGDWFVNYAGWWVQERAAAEDSIMLGGQVGWRRSFGDRKRLTAGIGYYDYLETQGRTPFYDGAGNGNRVDALGNYVSDFNSAELFTELSFPVGARTMTVFADYVTNAAVGTEDDGFAIGASFGDVSRRGDWRIAYAYQDLEADAVVAAFTDSDFAGGGTNGSGHVIELNYAFRDRWQIGVRYFANERGGDVVDRRHDYDRLQAEIFFAY